MKAEAAWTAFSRTGDPMLYLLYKNAERQDGDKKPEKKSGAVAPEP